MRKLKVNKYTDIIRPLERHEQGTGGIRSGIVKKLRKNMQYLRQGRITGILEF